MSIEQEMAKNADVVIVGGGAAGFVVAERLRERGLSTVVLEAGPATLPTAQPPEPDRRAWAFRVEGGTFDWYRVRALRGRGLLWGGWCYRQPPEALLRAGCPPEAAAGIAGAYERVERDLGVLEGTVDERYGKAAHALGLRVHPKRAPLRRDGHVWVPYPTRRTRGVRAGLVALRVEHQDGSASAVACLHLERGSIQTFGARAFVLAASPIETARILLESELGPSRIGRGLVDHLVAGYLLIEPRPPPPLEARGAFPGCALFTASEPASSLRERGYRGGFSIEVTGPEPLSTFAAERFVPSESSDRFSATLLHALGEAFPHEERYVTLSSGQRDTLGRRVPIIHAALSREDVALAADMKLACVNLADAIAAPASRLVPIADPHTFGVGHEAGTCAMGDDTAPCDADGRLRTLSNVWIADASVLPTSGDRHPTLTILAQALRAADSLAKSLRS